MIVGFGRRRRSSVVAVGLGGKTAIDRISSQSCRPTVTTSNLFSTEVLKCYSHFSDFVRSKAQMITDMAALYRDLKAACKSGVRKSILKRYSNAQDGLKV